MSDRAFSHPVLGTDAAQMMRTLDSFSARFTTAVERYDGSAADASALEQAMAEYAAFVTDPQHEAPYAELVSSGSGEVGDLIEGVREQSARCAAVLEKYRALRLLTGHDDVTGYFENVESCIDEEFGAVAPTSASTLLLVGSGSFPMTLINATQRTGARVAGFDIDPEAITLGRQVLDHLARRGEPLGDIALHDRPATQAPITAEATHIVFSSTIAVKYELMDELFALTRDDVVVAMRFGDGLKSLFNYPSQDVDPTRWRLVQAIRQPGQVFDVALYEKAPGARTPAHGASV